MTSDSCCSEPYTEILGDSPEDSNTLYIDIRSVLNLTCVVYSPEVPAAIFWKHNGKVFINYINLRLLLIFAVAGYRRRGGGYNSNSGRE